MSSLVVAIDGPSGSGKSSTARGVAEALDFAYLDTGAMYRAVTTEYLARNIDPADTDAIVAVTREAQLDISTDPTDQWIRINGRNVTQEIRDPQVSAAVSTVATIAACRADLVARQQSIIADTAGGIVAEGRDVTTVVAPDAAVRLLLVADARARVARRAAELGEQVDAADVTDQVIRRDKDDSQIVEFHEPAPGVDLLDSTWMSLDEVVANIVARVRKVA